MQIFRQKILLFQYFYIILKSKININWNYRNQKVIYQKQKQHSKVLLFYVLKNVLISCVLTFYTESLVLVRICYFFE